MLADHERQADTNRYGLTEHELAADREAMKAREALAEGARG